MKNWHPPRKPDDIRVNSHTWPRLAFVLHQIATTGLSVRHELAKHLAAHCELKLKSKPVRYTFQRLDELHLIEATTLMVVEGYRMAVLHLAHEGRTLCRYLGWEVVESEYERMIRLHSGDSQSRHTAGVLSMAYHARLRGWQVQVVPSIGHPSVFPDLLLEKDGEQMYVEVELRHGKLNKWRNLGKLQGYVALCAKTHESRETLMGECQQLGIPVIATDLLSLAQTHTLANPGPLWLQNWNKGIIA